MRLHGRIALIPGASRPIGRAIARRFGEEGATLVLPVHDWPESTREMTEEFEGRGFAFVTMPVDLRAGERWRPGGDHRGKVRPARCSRQQHRARRHAGGPRQLRSAPQPRPVGTRDRDDADRQVAALPPLPAPAAEERRGGDRQRQLDRRHDRPQRPAALVFNDGYSAANRTVSSFTETCWR